MRRVLAFWVSGERHSGELSVKRRSAARCSAATSSHGNGHHSRMQPFSDMAIEATDGTGFSVCTLRDSGLTVNFLPQPSEGRTVMAMSHEDAARLMSEPAAEVVG